MVVTWQGLLFAFSTVPETAAVNFDRAYAQVSPGRELVVSSVQFGEVRGRKTRQAGESWRGPFKQVDDVLVVPGGHVEGRVAVGTKIRDEMNCDESKVERYLHTLRITVKQPPTPNHKFIEQL